MGDGRTNEWNYLFMMLLCLTETSTQYDGFSAPPKFPDLFSSFAESLSSSDNLRHLVNNFIEENKASCMCSEVTKVNWTEFNAALGSYPLPVDHSSCGATPDQSTHSPNVAAVSAGERDQKKALIVGLSIFFAVILLALIILLTIKKDNCIRAAWVVVKRRSVTLQRQRSDCQPALPPPSNIRRNVVSTSDSVAYSDTVSVTNVSCCNFQDKVKTILLPLTNPKQETGLKREDDDVFGFYSNARERSNTNHYAGKSSEMSNVQPVPGSEVLSDVSATRGKREDHSIETKKKKVPTATLR